MFLETLYAGVDGGNDASKIVTSWKSSLLLPNVIRFPNMPREKFTNQGFPEEELDVVITSPALGTGPVHVFVGKLATNEDENKQMEKLSNKALENQPIITMLTGLAYLVAEHLDGELITINVVIGTGLPIDDQRAHRKTFRERLKGIYTVEFQTTPKWEKRKIVLNITHVDIGLEGASTLLNLANDYELPEELMVPD